MNSFPILFGRQSRHIGRTLFRAWTVTSGDWSTSWPSVTDVRLRVTITNPAKTWWPQLTSMQCFYCIQEKGFTWFLCMLLFVWNCAKILCNHIKVFARNSCMLLFVSFSCKEFAWNSCKFQMRFMWVTFACVAILLQITTKRDGFTASNHNWQ